MKRALLAVGFVVAAAAGGPARAGAQLAGMPVWNSPKGGTGLLIALDFGLPDSTGGKGSTYAARAALGLRALTLSATVGSRNPPGTASTVTEYGGSAAFRIVGGSLIPVSINLQGGVSSSKLASVTATRFTTAVGLAVDVPVPGLSVEPWVAPGIRFNHVGASGPGPATTNSGFGIAGGLTFGFGLFGVHTAFDYEKRPGGGHTTTFGIGAHLDIRPSLGL